MDNGQSTFIFNFQLSIVHSYSSLSPLMTGLALKEQAESMMKNRPDIRPGFTVRVHQKVQEGDKERIQIFEGLVIGMHRGHSPTDTSFTVRRIASGVGVERVFPLHSPLIEKIEVKKVAEVRRAKLNFLRGRSGKRARISERFTSAEEFGIAAAGVEAGKEPAVEAVVETSSKESGIKN
jgi:large subunit ribosomal protein L19